ncbi:MAG TPA: VWA domain-containing protein [Bryobacteraceae bacterium]|jgi:VWFA-related protein
MAIAGVLVLGLAALHGRQIESAGTHLVVCDTTVQDKSGRPVTDLKQSAFTVSENGVKQEIRLFRHNDGPVSLGLLIDNSGSMRDKRNSVEAAALELVKASNPGNEVFVVNFNDEVHFDNPHGKNFTTDRQEIQEALTRIDSRGDTAIWKAIVDSIAWMKKAHRETHVLVVVTDGVDDASHLKLEDLVRSAQQSDVTIYVIGLLADEEKRSAHDARRQLSLLAEATGGEAFYPHKLADVERIAQQVARQMSSQYVIGYKPSNEALDGAFRRIKVTVKAAGRPTVRTRTGDYAAADPASN